MSITNSTWNQYYNESNFFQLDKIVPPKTNTRPKSVCEGMLTRNFLNENAPPIPPPPLNYTIPTTHVSGMNNIYDKYVFYIFNTHFYLTDDSLSEDDTKTTAVSTSCMHKATVTEGSCNSISRKSKTTKRIARQAQLKRYTRKIFHVLNRSVFQNTTVLYFQLI